MSINSIQYDALMRRYAERRFRNQNILEQRIAEVYDRIPHLSEIDREIASLSVSEAKARLSGNTDDEALYANRLASLSAERGTVLSESGYPASYLDPVYDCPDCHDTGYIGNEKCHCFRKAVVDLLYKQTGIASILKRENFETFSLSYYSDNYIDPVTGRSSLAAMRDTVKTCREFVDTFDTSFRNLFLYGSTGTGKTFLSNCIAGELLKTSHSVIYLTSFKLFDILAREKFSRDLDSTALSACIFDCDLLIIDDLGTELTNSFVSSELFLCINERILREQSTIISTNLSLENFAEIYSERTFSRISSSYTLLKLFGDDIRIKKKLRSQQV